MPSIVPSTSSLRMPRTHFAWASRIASWYSVSSSRMRGSRSVHSFRSAWWAALSLSRVASRIVSSLITWSGGRMPPSDSAVTNALFSSSGTLRSSASQSLSSARPCAVIWYVVRSGCLPSRTVPASSMSPYFSRLLTTV